MISENSKHRLTGNDESEGLNLILELLDFITGQKKRILNKNKQVDTRFEPHHLLPLFPCQQQENPCLGFITLESQNQDTINPFAKPCSCKEIYKNLLPFTWLQLLSLDYPAKNLLLKDKNKQYSAWIMGASDASKQLNIWNLLLALALNEPTYIKELYSLLRDKPNPSATNSDIIYYTLQAFQKLVFSHNVIYLEWKTWDNILTYNKNIIPNISAAIKNTKLIILNFNSAIFRPNSSQDYQNVQVRSLETLFEIMANGRCGLVAFANQNLINTQEKQTIANSDSYYSTPLNSYKDANNKLRFTSTRQQHRPLLTLTELLRQSASDKLFELLALGQKILDQLPVDKKSHLL